MLEKESVRQRESVRVKQVVVQMLVDVVNRALVPASVAVVWGGEYRNNLLIMRVVKPL